MHAIKTRRKKQQSRIRIWSIYMDVNYNMNKSVSDININVVADWP